MSDEPPEGWATARVTEVIEDLQSGFASGEKAVEGGVAHLRMNNIGQDGELVLDLVRTVPEKLARAHHDLTPGDVLVCTTNSATLVGKCAYFDLSGRYTFSNHLTRLRPKANVVDGQFLRWNLWFQWKSGAFEDKCKHWVNQSTIPKEILLDTEVVVPPIGEQRRIVRKLEALMGKVDICQARLPKILALIKRFRQSVLAAACSGRLTVGWRDENPDVESASATIERMKKRSQGLRVRRGVPDSVPLPETVVSWELPKAWACSSAADLLRCGAFVDIKDGNHGANHPKVREFSATGMPFITAAQVSNFRIDYENAHKISGKPLARINVGFAKPGDVIYTHKGSVGRVAIADRDCILTPQTTYYRLSPEVFVNGFLMLYLASPFFGEQVDIVKEQTTRDFVPISEQYLLFHRIPPIAEQQEIVRHVGTLLGLADQIEARATKAQVQIGQLAPSLIAKALRGELVPTEAELARAEGRGYESASDLLERIRAACAAEGENSGKGRPHAIGRLRSKSARKGGRA